MLYVPYFEMHLPVCVETRHPISLDWSPHPLKIISHKLLITKMISQTSCIIVHLIVQQRCSACVNEIPWYL